MAAGGHPWLKSEFCPDALQYACADVCTYISGGAEQVCKCICRHPAVIEAVAAAAISEGKA